MRKDNFFSAVLLLFLLVPASITRAQTISSQKGLTTAVFSTQYGNVKIHLPDDIRPGEIISGTVVAEPKGTNARQLEKNLAELKKNQINVVGNKVPVTDKLQSFQCTVPSQGGLDIALSNINTGTKVDGINVPFDGFGKLVPPSEGCVTPTNNLVGEPVRIIGNFDGNITNTQCLVNSQPAQTLAESPRQCIAQYPQTAQGPSSIQVKENGQEKCTNRISGVDMQIRTGDLNLRKGQSTYIDVKVVGLEGLPDKAVLTITNTTPNIVTMTNGNVQVIPIWPTPDSAHGTFSVHCPAVSITTGTFVVEINLDLPQPGQTSTPTEEIPPGYTKRSCDCSVTATVSKSGNNFTATASSQCKGVYGIGINTFCACSVLSTAYKWTIQSGSENVDLIGKTDAAAINVRPKNNGAYTVCVTVTTTCIDGTVCTTTACADQSGRTVSKDPPTIPKIPVTDSVPTTTTDSIPTTIGMVCSPAVQENADPKMVGGLKSKQTGTGTTSTIFRDDFIALQAEGSDVDLVTFMCNPQKPCPDSKSQKTIAVTGKVKFEWEITGGEGRFVKLGCGSEDEKRDKGEHVVFQPPYVALPVKNPDTTLTTIITLTILDDGSPVPDAPVVKIITIKTIRKKSLPDKYEIVISGGAADKPAAPALPVAKGTCELIGPVWKPGDDLAIPEIILPGVADAGKMVLGQWIVLKTQDQADPDPISFNCVSKDCTSSGDGRSYPDNILWEWSKTGPGDFILGNMGQYIIYQAPMDMPAGKEVIEIKIKLKVMNPGGERKDPDKTSKEFTLYIYQPGVKLSHPDLAWIPKDDNSLELKSELMYKDGGKWLPALSHMCRIHYFELLNVSTEKGVCLNAPEPKDADDCRDLNLKNEKEHESFDDAKASGTKCDTKELYQQARTKRPEKEYSITIYSRDFGSYGFLRSFANVNKKTSLEGKPIYISIPVKKTDVVHPGGRMKKTEYPDNRVTIPHDIDENRIADGGWTAKGGIAVPDPADNKIDEDDNPKGDEFKGDGITNYEEYRGFKISTKGGEIHQRTNIDVKDIFIRKETDLPIGLYEDVSKLDVHTITEAQYISDEKRFINFNFNKTTHLKFEQRGLHLVDKGSHSGLLGIAYSSTGQPTVPNAEIEIRVYTTKIQALVDRVNKGVAPKDKLSYTDKLAAIVAHELLHGNNVCHHGEGNPEVEKSFDLIHGLRSGNVDCVMRYDNVGTALSKIPEKPGTSICSSAAGTGYNANGEHFQDAAAKRGNCKGEIRISGAGGVPISCGNRK